MNSYNLKCEDLNIQNFILNLNDDTTFNLNINYASGSINEQYSGSFVSSDDINYTLNFNTNASSSMNDYFLKLTISGSSIESMKYINSTNMAFDSKMYIFHE